MNPLENPKWNFWQVLYLILLIYLLEFFLGWLKLPENLSYQQGYVNYLAVGFGEGLIFFVALFLFLKVKRAALGSCRAYQFWPEKSVCRVQPRDPRSFSW
jgi:polyferredoxin